MLLVFGSQGDRAVGVRETLEGRGPGTCQRVVTGRDPHTGMQFAVVQQLLYRGDKAARVAGRDRQSRDVADHGVLRPRAGADHRGQARGRRLKHRLTERLGVARRQEDVGRRVDRGELRAGLDAEKGCVGGEFAQALAVWSFADDDEVYVVAPGAQRGVARRQGVQPLLRRDAADPQQHAPAIAEISVEALVTPRRVEEAAVDAPVSYTHLTLPTNREVSTSVV